MSDLCIESISMAPEHGSGVVFVDYYNVSNEIATTAPPRCCGIEIDGYLNLYSPQRRAEEKPFRYGAWPFRSAEKGGADLSEPVWRWENPDEPVDRLSLSPALGVQIDGEQFEFYIRDGYVVPVEYAEI